MYMFRMFLLGLLAFGCSGQPRGAFRIGIDPLWYPLDFGPQTSYVNGYTEELLLEMAGYGGMRFELVRANFDTLLEGMRGGQYDAVITTLPPYEYNLAKY